MSEVSPLHPRVVYSQPTGDSSRQADIAIGVLQLDLTQLVNEQGVALTNTQMLTQGRDVQCSGDWIAVDSGAVGAVRVSPHSRLSTDDSVLLTPGKIYHRKFHNLRAFYSQVSGAQSGFNPADTGVYWRAFYGTGPVPFENLPLVDSAIPLIVPAPAQGVATTTTTISVTEGMEIDISVLAHQTTSVAANGSTLRTFATFNMLAGGTSVVMPDMLAFNDQPTGGAAVGTARLEAKYRDMIVPRGCVSITLQVSNFSTEATNTIAFDDVGVQVH